MINDVFVEVKVNFAKDAFILSKKWQRIKIKNSPENMSYLQ